MAGMVATAPVIHPADFTTVIENPYLPLRAGTTFIYKSPDGSVVDTMTVTATTRIIDGVRCVVVLDVTKSHGVLEERTEDYFAQDRTGNVWYFGEDVQNYKNGKLVGTAGSWRAGVHGAQPGVVMKAASRVGDSYAEENAAGIAQDQAEVTGVGLSVTVPFGRFDEVVATRETSPLEPKALEEKYYAKGVGNILSVDKATGEREELTAVEKR